MLDPSRGRLAKARVGADTGAGSASRRRWIQPIDVIDVLVYVVVLNLAAQYVPSVITETFTVSLLTALLLTVVLEVVVAVKTRAKRRLRDATTTAGQALGAVMLGSGGSKFVVLKLEDLVFEDAVDLAGFISVTLLILALLLSGSVMRRLLTVGTTQR